MIFVISKATLQKWNLKVNSSCRKNKKENENDHFMERIQEFIFYVNREECHRGNSATTAP